MSEINTLTQKREKSFAESNSELFFSGANFKYKGSPKIYRYAGTKSTGHIVDNHDHIVCTAAEFDGNHIRVFHPFFPIGVLSFHSLDFQS